MHKTKTFRTKLWLCFVLFAGVIFGLLWLMQAVFLQTFYNGMLEKNTRQAARKIVSAAGSAELTDLIDTLSNENSLLVFITEKDGTILYSSDSYKSYYHAPETGKSDEENPYRQGQTMNWQAGNYRNLPDGYDDFLERLNRDFPDMLIEGCSGGGGRFDMGMLYYTPQIWCSDNTDAIDRLRIQYGTSFVYPVSSVGAHVSAVPNEQTGRSVALSTRGLVAMGGTFGYELDPAKLSDAEKDQIRQQILDFKKYAHLITHGLYYRLSNPFSDGIAAWEMFAEDQSEALISVVCLEVHGNMTVNYVRLRGLRKDCFYRDEATGKEYPANALMQIGLPVPVEMGEYRSYRWHFRLVKKAELSAAE